MKFAASIGCLVFLAMTCSPFHAHSAAQMKVAPATIVVVPDDTPLGDAANDARTSAAVMAILQACADAYTSTPVFYSEGRYIISQKMDETSVSDSAKLTIHFRRPDLLRVEISGKYSETLFLADGTTVTMSWPKEKRFKQIPQPDNLAAFVEEERAGMMLDDDTKSVIRSTAPALLVSEDTLAWIHGNVDKYFFEGSEIVSGADTWRIKFVQSGGSDIVTLWVDKKTGFLRKNSTMMAVDESDDYVDSYAEGTKAAIIISIFDRISTRLSTVPKSRFRPGRVPGNWEDQSDKGISEDEAESSDGTSVFSKFFRAAAEETATTPTVTFESESGTSGALRLLWQHELPQRASAVASGGTHRGELQIIMQNKRVHVVAPDGRQVRQYRIAQPATDAALSQNGKFLFTISKNKQTVTAWDSNDGTFVWEKTLRGTLDALLPLRTNNALMVGGSKGIFVLSSDGDLSFSSRRVTDVTRLLPDPTGNDGDLENIIVTSDDDGITLFSADGHWLEEITATAFPAPICSTNEKNGRSFFALNEGEAGDVALQRIDSKVRPEWTVGVAAPAKYLSPTTVLTANLRLAQNGSESVAQGGIHEFLITQMNDGRISIFTPEGKPVWRGRIKTNDPLFMASLKDGVLASYATDLNGDGSDEIVVVLPRSVVALTVNE